MYVAIFNRVKKRTFFDPFHGGFDADRYAIRRFCNHIAGDMYAIQRFCVHVAVDMFAKCRFCNMCLFAVSRRRRWFSATLKCASCRALALILMLDSSPPLLSLRGMTKRFPGVVANAGVDLDLRGGEIHALLGENGAGKSTLVKMIYGVLQPDAGRLFWRGEETQIRDPAAARRRGIAMVFQHFSLFESLSVLENIALGLPPGDGEGDGDGGVPTTDLPAGAGDAPGDATVATPARHKNRRRYRRHRDPLRARIHAISARYGLPLHADRHVYALSVGERQRIEIVRCMLTNPRLLIMDEPTSVLTPQEAARLFDTLRRLAAEGLAVL